MEENESKLSDRHDAGMSLARKIYDYAEMFVFALALVLLIFMFVGRLTVVSGPSMEKTLYDGEVMVVSTLGADYKPGDIIVFQSPYSHLDEGIVKRVIAVGGDTVDIDFENWLVYVNGEPVARDADGNAAVEPYVNFVTAKMNQYDRTFPYTVPEGELFVMGDNRNRSNDSRGTDIGSIDTRYVFGKVYFRIKPLSRLGVVR